ncbi:MAG TPA: glycosyl hydrolase family 28 protein [Flavitalea sp.]|nr:glycosyl hydrolase family 28 protein [Flavitalea sp.]
MITRFLFFITCMCACFISRSQYDVRQYGASGNGITIDTKAIQKAIDSAAVNNGGVVNFSAGKYKTGTLILKSNIELHLMPGATIIGSEDINDYTIVHQQYESRSRDLYAKYFLIYAENQNNISITGAGTIDGNGLKNFQQIRPQNDRPYMIRFVKCNRISLKDVQLLESANWTLHLLACTDVRINALTIKTSAEGNRDGIDIDACQGVSISDCHVTTTDDAIVMKSTSDEVCRDIAITNCLLSSKGSALKTGTESNGGFKNIVVSNCVIKDIPDHAGIELMTVDGGMMENIALQNMSMENVATPFFIRIGLRARPYKSKQYVQQIGNVNGITLNNITVKNARLPSSIIGVGNKKPANISITNYTVNYTGSQTGVPYNKVPMLEFEYPAANIFTNLPAFALYCRDAEGLYLQNIKVSGTGQMENRPAFVFDRVRNLQMISIEACSKSMKAPLAYFRNTGDVVAAFCKRIEGGKNLFEIEGSISGKELFVNNFLQYSQSLVFHVPPLPDKVNPDSLDTHDLSHDLKKGTITFTVKMKAGGIQFCVMVMNKSAKPRKIRISYKDVQQEFVVDWKEWGWAPFTLLKEFSEGENVNFTIDDAASGSALRIAKYYLRSQNNGYTD